MDEADVNRLFSELAESIAAELVEKFDEVVIDDRETMLVYYVTSDDELGSIAYTRKKGPDGSMMDAVATFFVMGADAVNTLHDPEYPTSADDVRVTGVAMLASGKAIDPELGAVVDMDLVYVSVFPDAHSSWGRSRQDTPHSNSGEWAAMRTPTPWQVKVVHAGVMTAYKVSIPHTGEV